MADKETDHKRTDNGETPTATDQGKKIKKAFLMATDPGAELLIVTERGNNK